MHGGMGHSLITEVQYRNIWSVCLTGWCGMGWWWGDGDPIWGLRTIRMSEVGEARFGEWGKERERYRKGNSIGMGGGGGRESCLLEFLTPSLVMIVAA